MRSIKHGAAIAGAALLAAGCTTVDPVTQSPDPSFGEALKYDMAVQTIDPDPPNPPDAAQPGEDGDRGARAVKRLRTGQAKPVETTQTTQSQSGQSSGPR